jgi:hypothetical protein
MGLVPHDLDGGVRGSYDVSGEMGLEPFGGMGLGPYESMGLGSHDVDDNGMGYENTKWPGTRTPPSRMCSSLYRQTQSHVPAHFLHYE